MLYFFHYYRYFWYTTLKSIDKNITFYEKNGQFKNKYTKNIIDKNIIQKTNTIDT